jgi:hypothetical protein
MEPQDTGKDDSSPAETLDVSQMDDEDRRKLALKRIERKRKFRERAVVCAVIGLALCVIWAISEYHNAGGWPSSATSFSESSGQPGVWNMWIVYPLLVLALIVVLDACFTYLRKPISESDVRREMDRLK